MGSSVVLIDEGLSHGEPELDKLKLCFHKGQPAVFWAASWEGPWHRTDGASGFKIIPPELLPNLTAKSLTNWMLGSFAKGLEDMADFAAFATDARVTSWCTEVRWLYSGSKKKKR